MPNDRSERKTYRKSPGRQYGYDYDPLHSQSGKTQSGLADKPTQSNRWQSQSNPATKSGSTSLAQRPDLRRTRQLLRQNIIAGKTRSTEDFAEEQQEAERTLYQIPTEAMESTDLYGHAPTHNSLTRPYMPSTSELMDTGEEEEEWDDYDPVDPDLGYDEEDPLDVRMDYVASPHPQSPSPRVTRKITPTRSIRPATPEDLDEYEDEQEELPSAPKQKRRRRVSRRGMLVGIGLVAAGGAGLAAYELAPKVPQAVGDAGANVASQINDAFKQGMTKGADDARKEFITALENLEGFTLDGAITAAKITRVAYDTFVSPIIQAGSAVTGEVLSGMLSAFKTARSWLKGASLDNATLAAIEKVLQSWVDQSSNMPKQINAITQTDLEGAQAYLRALQRKIDAEKAALNKPTSGNPPVAQPTPQSPAKK